MTEKETEKAIEVMQAYVDGKKIQCRYKLENEWHEYNDGKTPVWDWCAVEYRIKPESKLRPYNNAKEFLQAQKEHGPYLIDKNYEHRLYIPVELSDVMIWFHDRSRSCSYKNAVDRLTWQDGSPCGIMEE